MHTAQRRPLLERLMIFAGVGTLCLLLQIVILKLLKSWGIAPYTADAVAFLVSAQLNFWLSYKLTWADSARVSGQTLVRKWLQFLGVVTLGTAANVFVYSAVQPLSNDYVAVIAAVMVSGALTFKLNHWLTFRFYNRTGTAVDQLSQKGSLAWFMPAHNEAPNLRHLVPEIVGYLQRLGCQFSVIIVNDGSTDDTLAVCQELTNKYPQVRTEHHEVNRGYGAALRSGLKASLETGHSLIGFCDADRQFSIESLGPMLQEIEEAHAVFGYRRKRADSMKRRLMGWGWTNFSKALLGYSARDADCGFKLFRREVVENLTPRLRGDAAVISPEMITWTQKLGYLTAEVSVEHHRRLEGKQSGAKMSVVLKSIVGLFRTYYHIHVAPDVQLRTSEV